MVTAPLAHHGHSDVSAVQIAHADTTILRALAVELAPKFATEHKGTHSLACLGAARLITFRSREALQWDRQPPTSIVSPSRTCVMTPVKLLRGHLAASAGAPASSAAAKPSLGITRSRISLPRA
jgi:hypothetical protein